MAIFAILIFSIFLTSSADNINYEKEIRESKAFEAFLKYLEVFNVTVPEKEIMHRLMIFVENIEYIFDRNNQSLGYELGLNQFLHLTHAEYLDYLVGYQYDEGNIVGDIYKPFDDITLLDIDYRALGVVSKVKNQMNCGSCWAFSATGCLESQYMLRHIKKISLSEQELLDCSNKEGNRGCHGGEMSHAFLYAKRTGLPQSAYYPYTAKAGKCEANDHKRKVFVKNIFHIPRRNETILSQALVQHGPISVAIDAGDMDFRFYKSGIYESTACSGLFLNHGVLLVGIGSDPQDHYIVKNSWGRAWGDKGYILMARNKDNMCGIASQASFALIESP